MATSVVEAAADHLDVTYPELISYMNESDAGLMASMIVVAALTLGIVVDSIVSSLCVTSWMKICSKCERYP